MSWKSKLTAWWNKIWAWIQGAVTPVADDPIVTEPFNPVCFCGAGNVNHWRDNPEGEVLKIARSGLQAYHIAIFGWADTQSLGDPDGVVKDLLITIAACKRRNVALFAEVVNDNLHSDKYNNTPVQIGDHLTAIKVILQCLKDNYWDKLFVQPVGETQTTAGAVVEGLASQYLPKACIVSNTNGGDSYTIPSWATFGAVHRAHLSDPIPRPLWDVTDHGTALNELGGTMSQVFNNEILEADAQRAREAGNPYVLYGFQVKAMDEGNLAAVARGYGLVTPTPVDPDPPPVTDVDEISFSTLTWKYGGFNGAGAVLSEPQIGNLRMDGRSGMHFDWTGPDLSAWGLGFDEAENGAVACLFVRLADGAWIGGKFEWVSSSRTFREFDNIFEEHYNGWSMDGVPNPCKAAFVIVSADGRKRSNVIVGDWRR